MEDPFESSEQESALTEEDSKDISSAPGSKTKMENYSMDERATHAVGEGQYEPTSQPTPSLPLIFSQSLSFFCIFHLPLPYIFHFSKLH